MRPRIADFDLGTLTRETVKKLDALLHEDPSRVDLIDVAAARRPLDWPTRCKLALDDPNVDAVVALHVPRPALRRSHAAEALATVSKDSAKPVLAAWMGAVDRQEVHAALEAGRSRISSHRRTPSTRCRSSLRIATTRHGCSKCRRRSRSPSRSTWHRSKRCGSDWSIRRERIDGRRDRRRARRVRHRPVRRVDRLAAARRALRATWRYPLLSELERRIRGRAARRPHAAVAIEGVDGAAADRQAAPAAALDRRIVLREGPRDANAPGLAVGVATDRRFGPVIWIQRGSESHSLVRRRVVMLPPLNARLAADAIASALADGDVRASPMLRSSTRSSNC